MHTKAFLFDFFGVVCSELAELWFAKCGQGMNDDTFRTKYVYPYDRGDVSDKEFWKILGGISGKTDTQVKEEWVKFAVVNLEVLNFVKEVKKTHQVALITNAGSDFFWSIMGANNIRELFPTVVVSSEEKVVKPDSRIYTIALERMARPANEVIFIDDRVENIEGAARLNIRGLQFESLDKLQKDLARLAA